MKTFLIIGACGVGKTWVMQQLIDKLACYTQQKEGSYIWNEDSTQKYAILGKYEDRRDPFGGSDKLSMSVMRDNEKVLPILKDRIVIAEGDRFTCETFIRMFDPYIIKIQGNGAAGRTQRGTSQTARQIQSIYTRVSNITPDYTSANSSNALILLMQLIHDGAKYNRKGMELF
jgi:hypothetical protein